MENKKLLKDRRGQLGLDTVKAFMVLILVVAIIGFLIVVVMTSLESSADTLGATITGESQINITLGVITETPITIVNPANSKAVTCSVPACINGSESDATDEAISTGNYTISNTDNGCTIAVAAGASAFNFSGATWNCTYSFTYEDASAQNMLRNVSSGTSTFFADADTWFTLLSIVIIILIIAIVIFVVSGFGRTTEIAGRMVGGRGSEGSEGLA